MRVRRRCLSEQPGDGGGMSPAMRTHTEGVGFYLNPKSERRPETWENCIRNRVIPQILVCISFVLVSDPV